MAPTKRARAQTTTTTTKSSKKAKVTSSSSKEKKKPAKLAVPKKNERKKNNKKVVISDRPVYSPNVDTDGFTEDDEDENGAGAEKPRYASYAARKGAGKEVGDDGLPSVKSTTAATAATKAIATGPEQRKTARQLRAERRNAEKPVGDFTDDDEVGGAARTSVAIAGPVDQGDDNGDNDDDGWDDERLEAVLGGEVPPGPAHEEDVERFLNIIKESTKSEDPAVNPFSKPANAPSIPALSPYFGSVNPDFANLDFKPIKGVHYGAAGKYLDMMRSKGLLPSPPRYTPASLSSSSSSSSSSGNGFAFKGAVGGGGGGYGQPEMDEEGEVTIEVSGLDAWNSPLTYTWDDSELIHGAPPGTRVRDWKGDDYEDDDGSAAAAAAAHEWTVHPDNGVIDRVITKHMRNIAQLLNFMVRATMSGIDVSGDLAAVPRRKWRQVKEAPEGAAEAVAAILLDQSGASICMLAERASAFREDLARLKIDILGEEEQ
ncbi:hypothetical protein F5Y08DRAFT_94066 [Xylaria arbuscula]|nr:hypothetical protein F5Y08DRAFT_94066 [Xylaria arbuscula]